MNKKKVLAFVIVMILMIGTLAGCSESTGGTVYIPDNSLEVIKDRGKLIVGTAPGYFPFEMINEENEVIGYDIEIANYLAESLGVELEIADYDWNGLTPALQTDKIDLLLSGMTITGARAANVDFSIPYFRTGQSLMVNKENP